MTLYKWSQIASADATADGTVNWAEGQSPSSVNDSARAMMAATAKYRDDIAGAITTSGSATAYTVTSYEVFDTLAHLSGQMIAFVPHATNTNAVGVDVTLNVDGLGAKSIRIQPSVVLPNGSLVLGTPYCVVYNNSDAVFYLHGMTNPYNVPLAAGFDFWGTTAPNTSFAFPAGQAISRTTYATLFSIMSTTYGIGDGSTTFNLPDKTGRVSAMKEATATRLTTADGLIDGATMGATGTATQKRNLTIANLDSFSFTPTVSAYGLLYTMQGNSSTPSNLVGVAMNGANNTATNTGAVTGSITMAATTLGSGTAHSIVQPTIVCNYIIRII
jgi:microcystin-dependent protein